jgi:hypothetical protein
MLRSVIPIVQKNARRCESISGQVGDTSKDSRTVQPNGQPYPEARLTFFYPDSTVGSGISPVSAIPRFREVLAGLFMVLNLPPVGNCLAAHPALKVAVSCCCTIV